MFFIYPCRPRLVNTGFIQADYPTPPIHNQTRRGSDLEMTVLKDLNQSQNLFKDLFTTEVAEIT